jgi:hypothetical protein
MVSHGVKRSTSASTAALAMVDLEPFPLLSNVSLHWRSAGEKKGTQLV